MRRADIEGEFELLLASAKPTPGLVKIATAMFKQMWDARVAQIGNQAKALQGELLKVEKQITQFIDRAIATDAPAMIAVYEGKVVELTTQKSLIEEKIANSGRPASSFDASLRTALDFLANPSKLWNSGSLESRRRAVLKLTFAVSFAIAGMRALEPPLNCPCPLWLLARLEPRKKRNGAPYGIRTRVTALKGPCPRPLDERDGPRGG